MYIDVTHGADGSGKTRQSVAPRVDATRGARAKAVAAFDRTPASR